MDRDDELPIVEVFAPEAAELHAPEVVEAHAPDAGEVFAPEAEEPLAAGGLEPVVRGRGTRRWVRWGTAATVAAVLAAGIAVGASDDVESPESTPAATPGGDERAATDAAPPLTPEPAPTSVPPQAPEWSDSAIAIPSLAGPDRPETRFVLPDGTAVVIGHPEGITDDAARVNLTGSVQIAGIDCCHRHVEVVPVPFDDLFADHRPVVELFEGEPARGALFANPSLLAFAAGPHTVVLLAPPNDTFSPAELELYRRLLTVTETPSGYPRLSATPPLVVEGAAHVVLEDESGVTVGMYGPIEDCRPDAIADPPSVVLSCVGGWQVFTTADSDDDVLSRQPRIETSVRDEPAPSTPLGAISDGALTGPVETRDTRVVAGGHHSGVVAGILATRRSVSWVATIGDVAFVAPVAVDGMVFVASSSRGPAAEADASTAPRLYGLDAATGSIAWSLPLDAPGDWFDAPVVDGDVLVVRSGPGTVDAIKATTGQPLWRFETGTPVSTVTLDAGVVSVVAGGVRTELDATTGAPVG